MIVSNMVVFHYKSNYFYLAQNITPYVWLLIILITESFNKITMSDGYNSSEIAK